MKIEMLISTCKTKSIKDLSLKEKNIKNAVIVNQFMPKYYESKENGYVMYSYDEKGLSKSRNRLLEHMSGDIEVIVDDDITFTEDALEVIEKAYKEKRDRRRKRAQES